MSWTQIGSTENCRIAASPPSPAVCVGQPASPPRYFNEAVNGRLLNEFLKEHGQMQQLKATVARQQEEIYATIAQQ